MVLKKQAGGRPFLIPIAAETHRLDHQPCDLFCTEIVWVLSHFTQVTMRFLPGTILSANSFSKTLRRA